MVSAPLRHCVVQEPRATFVRVRLQDELFAVLAALSGARIEYALCGGFAVILHG